MVSYPPVLAWVGFVLSLICLFRQLGCANPAVLSVWVNSDTLWQANVFSDVFRDHYSFSGWVFSIAPCWFPDLIATGVFWFLTRNVILATLLAGFIQIALLVGAFRLCRRALGIGDSVVQDAFLLALGVSLALYVAAKPSQTYPGLYELFLPQTHVGSLIVVLYGLGLGLLLIRKKSESQGRPLLVSMLFALVCFLGGMSNILFFVHFLLPLSTAVVFAVFLDALSWKDAYEPVLMGWLVAAVGALLNRLVFHATSVAAQAAISINRMMISLDVFLRGAIAKILVGDALHWMAIAWLTICIGYLFYTLRALIRSAGRISLSVRLVAVFLLSCVLSSVFGIGAIIVGGSNGLADFKDYVWTMHYLHPTFVLPVFGLVLLLAWGVSAGRAPQACRRLALIVAVLAVLAPSYQIAANYVPRQQISVYRPPLVHFMDELARQEPLRYGYAGYWQARLITLLSNRGLRAYAVDGVLNPLLWVSNREWYSKSLEDRSKRPHIDFVVLDDPLWKISRESAVRALGEPVREVSFENTRVLIYSKRSSMAQSSR